MADHEAAAALGRKAGKRSCKELREAVVRHGKGLSSDDLALLGTLGSVLPALEELHLMEPAAGPDGVQRLAEKLGAGALPAVTSLILESTPVGDAGAASALAAALGRGALPRLKYLVLDRAPPSATRGWWPSRRPCGGCPRWSGSNSGTTRSAMRASPPSWRRRRRQVRRRRRLVC